MKFTDSSKTVIVTPIHNGKDHTSQFLASLKRQDYANLTIVIVDDGSTDGSADMITDQFPEVVVLKGDGNLWWTGSTNLGVEYALKHQADFVFIVNNDVALSDDCLSRLAKTAAANPKSLVGSLVCYSTDPDRVWYAGGFFDRPTGQMAHHHGRRSDYHGLLSADWLTGMGMLIPAAAFGDAGLFDPIFPQYFADADFSLRAKQAGYKLLVDSSCVILADITSSWLNRQKQTGKLNFLPTLFFHQRSPFSLRLRYIMYRRHWGKGFRLALLRLYGQYFWKLVFRYKQTMEHV